MKDSNETVSVTDLIGSIHTIEDITCDSCCYPNLRYKIDIHDSEKVSEVDDDGYIYRKAEGMMIPEKLDKTIGLFSRGGKVRGARFMSLREFINTDCPSDVGSEDYAIFRGITF